MTLTPIGLTSELTSYQTSQASLYRAFSAGVISTLCDSYSTPCVIHVHQTPVKFIKSQGMYHACKMGLLSMHRHLHQATLSEDVEQILD